MTNCAELMVDTTIRNYEEHFGVTFFVLGHFPDVGLETPEYHEPEGFPF